MIDKLIKLADRLDAKGLYVEAGVVDNIIKSALDSAQIHTFQPDVMIGRKDDPKMRLYVQQLDKLRSLFGLSPGSFDTALSSKLLNLNKKAPGTWVPNSNQKISDLISKVQVALNKDKENNTAVTTDALRSRDPGAKEVHPPMQELFPPTKF